MKALLYLNITKIKNTIKDLKNHPSKIILIVLCVALLAFIVITGNQGSSMKGSGTMQELYGVILALFCFLFIPSILAGFSSGASFFNMSDVNMIFVSPIPSRLTLIYGLIKQLSTSIWIGFFILFQYAWVHDRYGVSFLGLLVVFLGYCLLFFCSQLTAMAIYTFSCNDDSKKRKVKIILGAIAAAILAILAVDVLSSSGDKIQAIINAVNKPWINFIPIVGWIRAFAYGLLSHSYLYSLLGLLATVLYVVLFVYIISTMDSDYYEDVLQATEISYSAINASKEGKVNDIPKNVKVGKTGLYKGKGSGVFFYKHMLEDRRSGIFLLDKNSIIFMVSCILFTFFTKRMDGGILPAFAFATYMQLLSSGLGRWIRELTSPFVYLIPESAFKKLINITKESILKLCVEATILFIAIGIIVHAPVQDVIACIIARIGFGILFIAGNILIERLFGSIVNKMLIMVLYFIVLIALIAPGIVAGVFVSSMLPKAVMILSIMGVATIWNILISAVVAFFCRDILNYAELNNK